jgi:hypothetical protein
MVHIEDQSDVLHTRSELLDGRSIPAREGEKNSAVLSRNYHVRSCDILLLSKKSDILGAFAFREERTE